MATLHHHPGDAWLEAYDEQLSRELSGFAPAHLDMTLWAMTQLEWRPEPPLWEQLQLRAEAQSTSYNLRSLRMVQRASRVLEKSDEATSSSTNSSSSTSGNSSSSGV